MPQQDPDFIPDGGTATAEPDFIPDHRATPFTGDADRPYVDRPAPKQSRPSLLKNPVAHVKARISENRADQIAKIKQQISLRNYHGDPLGDLPAQLKALEAKHEPAPVRASQPSSIFTQKPVSQIVNEGVAGLDPLHGLVPQPARKTLTQIVNEKVQAKAPKQQDKPQKKPLVPGTRRYLMDYLDRKYGNDPRYAKVRGKIEGDIFGIAAMPLHHAGDVIGNISKDEGERMAQEQVIHPKIGSAPMYHPVSGKITAEGPETNPRGFTLETAEIAAAKHGLGKPPPTAPVDHQAAFEAMQGKQRAEGMEAFETFGLGHVPIVGHIAGLLNPYAQQTFFTSLATQPYEVAEGFVNSVNHIWGWDVDGKQVSAVDRVDGLIDLYLISSGVYHGLAKKAGLPEGVKYRPSEMPTFKALRDKLVNVVSKANRGEALTPKEQAVIKDAVKQGIPENAIEAALEPAKKRTPQEIKADIEAEKARILATKTPEPTAKPKTERNPTATEEPDFIPTEPEKKPTMTEQIVKAHEDETRIREGIKSGEKPIIPGTAGTAEPGPGTKTPPSVIDEHAPKADDYRSELEQLSDADMLHIARTTKVGSPYQGDIGSELGRRFDKRFKVGDRIPVAGGGERLITKIDGDVVKTVEVGGKETGKGETAFDQPKRAVMQLILDAESRKPDPKVGDEPKKGEPAKKVARELPVPEGWTTEVGEIRGKEGEKPKAEVDWRNKRIVFSEQKHLDDPEIRNHEIAHIVFERLISEDTRKAMEADYIEAKKDTPPWKKHGVEWIVKNQFHREEIAMDLGDYFSNPDELTPEVRAAFDKHLPEEFRNEQKPTSDTIGAGKDDEQQSGSDHAQGSSSGSKTEDVSGTGGGRGAAGVRGGERGEGSGANGEAAGQGSSTRGGAGTRDEGSAPAAGERDAGSGRQPTAKEPGSPDATGGLEPWQMTKAEAKESHLNTLYKEKSDLIKAAEVDAKRIAGDQWEAVKDTPKANLNKKGFFGDTPKGEALRKALLDLDAARNDRRVVEGEQRWSEEHHRAAVEKAKREGKTIPEKVLDEYPELRDNRLKDEAAGILDQIDPEKLTDKDIKSIQDLDLENPTQADIDALIHHLQDQGKDLKEPKGKNYRITDEDEIGRGAAGQKLDDLEQAVKVLRKLEEENRAPTPAEQRDLVRFPGWGWTGNALHEDNAVQWRPNGQRNPHYNTYTRVRDLLTDAEFESAKGATPNSHFTSVPVVRAFWKALDRLGFKGGNALETSAGVGHFKGLGPEGVKWHAVELDDLTGRILKKLYPESKVHISSIQKAPLPEGFDLAASNVPFGDVKVSDRPLADKIKNNPVFTRIHNYFFAKGLDKVRPGGIVAFVTSHGTLDASDAVGIAVRNHIAEQADFLGAIRLPNNAFRGNAKTDVTTDLIFLRKRFPDEPRGGHAFQQTQMIDTPSGVTKVNEYFLNNPEMALGEHSMEGKTHRGGPDYALLPREAVDGYGYEDLSPALEKAIQNLPEGVYQEGEGFKNAPGKGEYPAPPAGTRQGSLYSDGKGVYATNRLHQPELISDKKAEVRAIGDFVNLREVLLGHIRAMQASVDDAALAEGQAALKAAYDTYVKNNGPLNRDFRKMLVLDPDSASVLSLEKWDGEEKVVKSLAPIFDKRVIQNRPHVESVDTAHDALVVSIHDRGKVDVPEMARLLGKSEKEVINDLKGQIWFDPAEDRWVASDEYGSGNVRKKLADAIERDDQDAVDFLTKRQPTDLEPEEISANPGATWIPTTTYDDFIADTLKIGYSRNERPRTRFSKHSGAYNVSGNRGWFSTVVATEEWGASGKNFLDLFEDVLNGKKTTIYERTPTGKVVDEVASAVARAKQNEIKLRWKDWVYDEPERARMLADTFNREVNNQAPRIFDGSQMTFPGMSPLMKPRPHQASGAMRIVQTMTQLLHWMVGTGKTAAMQMGTMELKRTGLRQKIVHVVPKTTLSGYAAAFRNWYPGAKLLVAEDANFNPTMRKRFAGNIATGDWDAIIMSQEQYAALPMSPAAVTDFFRQQIAEIVDAIKEAQKTDGKNAFTVKQMEKLKKSLEARLDDIQHGVDRRQDETTYFENLGIDHIMVDEAEAYKNLLQTSGMKGMSQKGSLRSFDMMMKVDHVRKNGGGITFASGTPISNSVAEMHTLMRYLAKEKLDESGMLAFDAWAHNFLSEQPRHGQDVAGRWQEQDIWNFGNIPELRMMYRQVADMVHRDDVETISVPRLMDKDGNITQKPIVVNSDVTDAQRAYFVKLKDRADKLPKGPPKKGDDNILNISTDGRMASIDLRLVDPLAEDHPDSKVNKAIANIIEIYKKPEVMEAKGTQIVFLDLGSPGSSRFDLYADMKAKLIRLGIPAKEIAFAQEGTNDVKMAKIEQRMRDGEIRVLIASTMKGGTGINVQDRIIGVHHLDPTWKPAGIEQRDGRAIRQGNMWDAIYLNHYVVPNSFDSFMWDKVARKQRNIDAVSWSENNTRSFEEDLSESPIFSASEISAVATGNPMMEKFLGASTRLRDLEGMRSSYVRSQRNLQWTLNQNLEAIPEVERAIKIREDVIKTRDDGMPAEFAMTVGKKKFTDPAEAGEALLKMAREIPVPDARQLIGKEGVFVPLGEIGPFKMDAEAKPMGSLYLWLTDPKTKHRVYINISDQVGKEDLSLVSKTTVRRIVKRIEELDDDLLHEKDHLERVKREAKDAREQMGKAWKYEEEYTQLQKEVPRLQSEIGAAIVGGGGWGTVTTKWEPPSATPDGTGYRIRDLQTGDPIPQLERALLEGHAAGYGHSARGTEANLQDMKRSGLQNLNDQAEAKRKLGIPSTSKPAAWANTSKFASFEEWAADHLEKKSTTDVLSDRWLDKNDDVRDGEVIAHLSRDPESEEWDVSISKVSSDDIAEGRIKGYRVETNDYNASETYDTLEQAGHAGERYLETGKLERPVNYQADLFLQDAIAGPSGRPGFFKRSVTDVMAEINSLREEMDGRRNREGGSGPKRTTRTGGADIPGFGARPEDIADAIKMGGLYAEYGLKYGAEWTAEMVSLFGEAVRPHLQQIYTQVKKTMGATDKEIEAEIGGPIKQANVSTASAPPPNVPTSTPKTGTSGGQSKTSTVGISQEMLDKRGLGITSGTGASPEQMLKRGRLIEHEADSRMAFWDKHKRVNGDDIAAFRARDEKLERGANFAFEDLENARKSGAAAPEIARLEKDYNSAKAAVKKWAERLKPAETEWQRMGSAMQGKVELDTGSWSAMSRAAAHVARGEGAEPTAKEIVIAQRIAKMVKEKGGIADDYLELLDMNLKEKARQGASGRTADSSIPSTRTALRSYFADRMKGLSSAKLPKRTKQTGAIGGPLPPELILNENEIAALWQYVKDEYIDPSPGDLTLEEIVGNVSLDLDIPEESVIRALADVKGKTPTPEEIAIRNARMAVRKGAKVEATPGYFAERQPGTPLDEAEAKALWTYARRKYLDNKAALRGLGTGDEMPRLRHVVERVASDLGITTQMVKEAFAKGPETKEISDAMWFSQSEAGRARRNARMWVDSGADTKVTKVLMTIVNMPRTVMLAGHGTVAATTHAGPNWLDPKYFKTQVRSTQDAFLMSNPLKGGAATHARLMRTMQRHENYSFWERNGLKIGMDYMEDYASQGGRFGRGMDVLKPMRLAIAERHWKEAPAFLKANYGKELARDIATQTNHMTGAVDTSKLGSASGIIGEAMIAPSLEGSRWARTIVDPFLTARTALRVVGLGKTPTPVEIYMAKVRAKRAGRLVGTYMAALMVNQILLKATGQEDEINFLDPRRGDWLAFKQGGYAISPLGGVLGPLRLLFGLGVIAFHTPTKQEEILKGSRKRQTADFLFNWGIGKLNPNIGIPLELGFRHDYEGNPLPHATDAELHGKERIDWWTYASEHLMIPVADLTEAVRDGMKEKGLGDILPGLVMHSIGTLIGMRIHKAGKERKDPLANFDPVIRKEMLAVDSGYQGPRSVKGEDPEAFARYKQYVDGIVQRELFKMIRSSDYQSLGDDTKAKAKLQSEAVHNATVTINKPDGPMAAYIKRRKMLGEAQDMATLSARGQSVVRRRKARKELEKAAR